MKEEQFDLAIVGNGIVGNLAALAALKCGYKVAIFGPEEKKIRSDGADARAYAISPATNKLFDFCGLSNLIEQESEEVKKMEIFHNFEKLNFDSNDIKKKYLARIVNHRVLLNICKKTIGKNKNLVRFTNTPNDYTIKNKFGQELVEINLESKKEDFKVLSKLILGADGVNSWCRHNARIAWGRKSYNQKAIVAQFNLSGFHKNIAKQWFCSKGIIALLPQKENKLSMVWSAPEKLSNEILQDSRKNFLDKLGLVIGDEITKLNLISNLSSVSLSMLTTNKCVSDRLVLMGDAAHTVHPLAGFGLNLGIFDIIDFFYLNYSSDTKKNKFFEKDIGSKKNLERYALSRKKTITFAQVGLDRLQWVFSLQGEKINTLRSLGINLLDKSTFLKKKLISRAISNF